MKHDKPKKRRCVDIFNNVIASCTRIKQILCIAGPVGGGVDKNLAIFFAKTLYLLTLWGFEAVPFLTNFYRIYNDLKSVFYKISKNENFEKFLQNVLKLY